MKKFFKALPVVFAALLFLSTGSFAQRGPGDKGPDKGPKDRDTVVKKDTVFKRDTIRKKDPDFKKDTLIKRDSIHRKDTVIKRDPRDNGPKGHGNGMGIGGGRLFFYFMNNDSCRAALEAQMKPEDAQALERIIATVDSLEGQLKTILESVRKAKAERDTATLRQLRNSVVETTRALNKARSEGQRLMAAYEPIAGKQAKDCLPPPPPKGPKGGENGDTTKHGPKRIIMVKPLFPNPVKAGTEAKTTLGYDLFAATKVTITISDAAGNILKTIELDQTAGSYKQALDLTGLQPGVYLVRVQAGEEVNTQKLMIR